MTTIEIIYMITMGLIAISSAVISKFQKVLIDQQKKMLDEKYKNDSELIKYCLKCIIKQSIDNEDFETASKCRDLLLKYDELDKNGL